MQNDSLAYELIQSVRLFRSYLKDVRLFQPNDIEDFSIVSTNKIGTYQKNTQKNP